MIKYFNSALLSILFVSPAYSEGKGLPQLDFTTYPSLIFWSILSLTSLYFIMAYVITPKISNVINDREQYLQNDLIKAKALKKESDDTLEKVNAELDKTKADAKSIIENAIYESQISSEKILNDFSSKLNEKIEKSLKDINKEEYLAFKDVLNESLELSDLIISKTTNIKSNKSKLTNILKQEVKILT